MLVTEHELHKNKDKYELHLLMLKLDKNLMEETFYATYSFKDLRLSNLKCSFVKRNWQKIGVR